MSVQGRVQHSSAICSVPLSEHTGNEICLVWVEEKDEPIAHYKTGPQGNTVADFGADYIARFGPEKNRRTLGTEGLKDRRDSRDPKEVGFEHLNNA